MTQHKTGNDKLDNTWNNLKDIFFTSTPSGGSYFNELYKQNLEEDKEVDDKEKQ